MKRPVDSVELSRPLQVDKISLGGVEEDIVASPAERAALATRFGLVELGKLEAHVSVDHEDGKMLAVTGQLRAEIVQECVVTLELLRSVVKADIDTLFAPPRLLHTGRDGEIPDSGDQDPPEPIENGVIDLGELVAQHLGTALDPYPRKAGAVFSVCEAKGEEAPPVSPLARLKDYVKNADKTKS